MNLRNSSPKRSPIRVNGHIYHPLSKYGVNDASLYRLLDSVELLVEDKNSISTSLDIFCGKEKLRVTVQKEDLNVHTSCAGDKE